MAALVIGKRKDITRRDVPTLISKGCSISGSLTANATVRIDGKVKGDVSVDEGLIVGEEGVIEGDIRTGDLVIYGTTKGNIHATRVEIKSSGRVTGEIVTRALHIDNGAIYNGQMSMLTEL
jgi:cytoskeletal protein CcmA (bactofilin family)